MFLFVYIYIYVYTLLFLYFHKSFATLGIAQRKHRHSCARALLRRAAARQRSVAMLAWRNDKSCEGLAEL